MKTYDPGHAFFLDNYSGFPEEQIDEQQILVFMHRIGDKYPGNQGVPYDGTNCQEVMRALIARLLYLDTQKPCSETKGVIWHLRTSLVLMEIRAAREHGLKYPAMWDEYYRGLL